MSIKGAQKSPNLVTLITVWNQLGKGETKLIKLISELYDLIIEK